MVPTKHKDYASASSANSGEGGVQTPEHVHYVEAYGGYGGVGRNLHGNDSEGHAAPLPRRQRRRAHEAQPRPPGLHALRARGARGQDVVGGDGTRPRDASPEPSARPTFHMPAVSK